MRKVLVVAWAELLSFVQTKAFWASVVLMPLLALGSAFVSSIKGTDTKTRHFAVIDHTGTLYPGIERAAEKRTKMLDAQDSESSKSNGAKFVPSLAQPRPGESLDELRLRLSESIRKDELFAFIELPRDVLSSEIPEQLKIPYNSDSPTYTALRTWVDEVVNGELRLRRYAAVGIAPEVVTKLERSVSAENMGLWERGPDGRILPAAEVDKVRSYLVPVALMFVMFMLIGMTSPTLLNAVIEEKVSRISEVLLGSVTPFQLMMGKLFGNTGVSLLLAAIYAAGGIAVAASYGYADIVPVHLLVYFVLFLVLATFLFGSLYLAVGAACSDTREAQTLLMPVMTVQFLPVFLFVPVMESPGSSFSVTASLVPFASPYLMMLRLALQPSPPAWQVMLSIALTLVTTLACVWAAARIFRVGLLLQGKPPTIGTLVRWVFASQ